MTETGINEEDTPDMDRIGLARTIQADKLREIEELARRRRHLGDEADRPSRPSPTSTADTRTPRLRPATSPANPVSGC